MFSSFFSRGGSPPTGRRISHKSKSKQSPRPTNFLQQLAFRGAHEEAVRKHFGAAAVYHGNQPVFKEPLLLIGFTNRTGSELLADHLRVTGALSGFREQLNGDAVQTLAGKLSVQTFPDYFRILQQKFGREGTPYGYKASWQQIMMLLRCRIDRLYTGMRIVHIVRDDIVAQAISFSIARQTQQWTSKHVALDLEPRFDFNAISTILDASTCSTQAISLICALFNIPRLQVSYEDLVANPKAVVRRAALFYGVDIGAWVAGDPSITKQGDAKNDSFRKQFVDEARRLVLD